MKYILCNKVQYAYSHLWTVVWRGNWYVLIPEWHPYYWARWYDIDIDVHGGLTYWELVTEEKLNEFDALMHEDIGKRIIWFDTCHWWDNPKNCPRSFVESECRRLIEQLESLPNTDHKSD